MGTLGLALLAGLLSTLSPCVVPLIPIVVGAAIGEHRLGPVALAAGLALSFVAIGLIVATVGFAIGLDQDVFRSVAAILMIAIGGVLPLPRTQERLATTVGPISNWAREQSDGLSTRGLSGQFLVGALLGALWSPCVGPTLGAASVLAARSERLIAVALTMAAFGLGAALPLLAIGAMSREALLRWRGRLLATGRGGKILMGILLVAFGAAIISGFDKRLEALLVEASPAWLTGADDTVLIERWRAIVGRTLARVSTR
jgi:cytochrome c-type biogenesis protein